LQTRLRAVEGFGDAGGGPTDHHICPPTATSTTNPRTRSKDKPGHGTLMLIKAVDPKSGSNDGPRVWMRPHDYMPDGYALAHVVLLADGTFNGSLVIVHRDQAFPPRFEFLTTTLKECCDALDRQFEQNMPDHECRIGCINWATERAVMSNPTGSVQ
jgi:hypothetical protein